MGPPPPPTTTTRFTQPPAPIQPTSTQGLIHRLPSCSSKARNLRAAEAAGIPDFPSSTSAARAIPASPVLPASTATSACQSCPPPTEETQGGRPDVRLQQSILPRYHCSTGQWGRCLLLLF